MNLINKLSIVMEKIRLFGAQSGSFTMLSVNTTILSTRILGLFASTLTWLKSGSISGPCTNLVTIKCPMPSMLINVPSNLIVTMLISIAA